MQFYPESLSVLAPFLLASIEIQGLSRANPDQGLKKVVRQCNISLGRFVSSGLSETRVCWGSSVSRIHKISLMSILFCICPWKKPRPVIRDKQLDFLAGQVAFKIHWSSRKGSKEVIFYLTKSLSKTSKKWSRASKMRELLASPVEHDKVMQNALKKKPSIDCTCVIIGESIEKTIQCKSKYCFVNNFVRFLINNFNQWFHVSVLTSFSELLSFTYRIYTDVI